MVSPALAQQPPDPSVPTTPVFPPGNATASPSGWHAEEGVVGEGGGFLTGNHSFPNFINFISNPLQSIDPRAVTAIYPIFGSEWVSNASPIPNGDFQLYGPAITIALSERLAVGLNQGGYADASFSSNPIERRRILEDEILQGRLRESVRARIGNADFSGDRSGWLNLGGFAQYTLIEDVPNQFLLTGGVRWEAPAGSHELFQGYGPLELAAYLTVGKEFGEFHVLATTGYEFPAGPGSDNSNLFYANVHFDRRLFGWLYPPDRVQLHLPREQRRLRANNAARLHRPERLRVDGQHCYPGGRCERRDRAGTPGNRDSIYDGYRVPARLRSQWTDREDDHPLLRTNPTGSPQLI
jgi:hypothetical protein